MEKIDEAVGHFSMSCKFRNVVDNQEWAFSSVYGPHTDKEKTSNVGRIAGPY